MLATRDDGSVGSSSGSRSRRAIWLATALILGLATLGSAAWMPRVVFSAPIVPTIDRWAVVIADTAVYTLLVLGILGALALLAGRRPLLAVAAALAILAASRIALVASIDAPLVSDWAHYHRLALGVLRGAPLLADTPMGYPILLALAYRVGGISVGSGEALNVLASILTGILVAVWVWRAAGGRAAALAVGILALLPSHLFFTALLGSETAYGAAIVGVALLLTESIRALGAGRRRRAVVLGFACGLVLGLSAYLRTTSLVLVPAVALVPLVAGTRWRRALPVAGALVLAVAIALAPALAANRTMLDRWSVSTSTYLGWQLYIGLNGPARGGYNIADARRVDELAGGPSPRVIGYRYAAGDFDLAYLRAAIHRDEVATQLAVARLQTVDPLQLPTLARQKLMRAWSPGDAPILWVVPPGADPVVSGFGKIAAQLGWFGILALAAAWYVKERRRLPPIGLVVGAIIVPITAALLILEAQARYHEAVVPLLAGLAGIAASAWWRWVAGRRAAVTSAGGPAA